MSADQADVRRQQRFEELCAAALRALTGERALHFSGHRLFRGGQSVAVSAPHLRVDPGHESMDSMRGAGDGLAMRLLLSDAALHRSLAPAHPIERFVFDLLEQYRCEALATLRGVRLNLRRRHEAWTDAFLRSRLTESVSGLLLFTLAQVVRSRLTGDALPDAIEDMMEGTRMSLAPAIGADLAGLRLAVHDQRAFAAHALAIAKHVATRADSAHRLDPERENLRTTREGEPLFALWVDPQGDGEDRVRPVAGVGSASPPATRTPYRVFTTAYDRERRAAAGIRRAQLRDWRERLDARIAAQGINVPRLARELRAVLAQPCEDGWDSAQEEGRIDGRRLATLIARPTERRLFRRERVQAVADAAVCFLLDCSGSMKVHAESLAVLADVTLRALELAGARAELLGFTTAAWNGGRAARDWQHAGSPPRPGRLNETLHLVFKDADTPWRRARPEIAALLDAKMFREGVDGEAVDWACERLRSQAAARRVLVVVSDGCPMDTATQRHNDDGLLDDHLRDVVARREAEGEVEIVALGVGLELSRTYRRSRVMEMDGAVGREVFRDLLELLAARARR